MCDADLSVPQMEVANSKEARNPHSEAEGPRNTRICPGGRKRATSSKHPTLSMFKPSSLSLLHLVVRKINFRYEPPTSWQALSQSCVTLGMMGRMVAH